MGKKIASETIVKMVAIILFPQVGEEEGVSPLHLKASKNT